MLTKSMFIRCVVIFVLSVLVQISDGSVNSNNIEKGANVSNVYWDRWRNITEREQGRGLFGNGEFCCCCFVMFFI